MNVTAGLFTFLYFCLKTSKVLNFRREPRSLNHYQRCLKSHTLHIMYHEMYSYNMLCVTFTLSPRMMFLLLKSKRAKDSYESQRVLLKKIKGVISSRAAKFSGYRQQVCFSSLHSITVLKVLNVVITHLLLPMLIAVWQSLV